MVIILRIKGWQYYLIEFKQMMWSKRYDTCRDLFGCDKW